MTKPTPKTLIPGAYYKAVGNVTYQIAKIDRLDPAGVGPTPRPSGNTVHYLIVGVGGKRLAGELGKSGTMTAGTFARKMLGEWTRRCRVCRCTDARACNGGCSWISLDLCSNDDEQHRKAPRKPHDPLDLRHNELPAAR